MYGATGYGTQPYASTYPQLAAGPATDILLETSESVLNGAGRLATFSFVTFASLLRSFAKTESKRFRTAVGFVRPRPFREFHRFRPRQKE